jgi:hypothetical protein
MLLFYLLWLAGWHFSQVTTLGIQHADGLNVTKWDTFLLAADGGGHRFPQELSREHNSSGEGRRTGPGASHYQAWPGTCRIHSHGAAGLWSPPERVAWVSGMFCTLWNKPWRREGEQIVDSEAHEGEWSRHAQVKKMCKAELYLWCLQFRKVTLGPTIRKKKVHKR